MATKWIVAAIMLCGLPQGFCPLLAQLPETSSTARLSSQDYLRLMEQANIAAGVQPSGGNFPGAKPRPRGSIEVAEPNLQPPALSLPPLPSSASVDPSGIATGAISQSHALPSTVTSLPSTSEPISQPEQTTTDTQHLAKQPWTGPRWIGRYGALSMRRPGDESMSFSQAQELGTFGSDTASEIALGFLTNPMDCYEFTYLGSLNWNRSLNSSGPVNSLLSSSDQQWMAPFQESDLIEQSHSSQLRQYGLNRRWLTDDIGNSTLGLRVIDYSEQYRLKSTKLGSHGLYGLDSKNLLVGLGSGMELWRPVSQRLAFGGVVDGGVYTNFASAGIQANQGNTEGNSQGNSRASVVDDQDISLATSFGLHLRARYQLRSWAGLYGGYRWMVVSGMATVDDQAPPPISDTMSLSTSSDATILFHGFDLGMELRF